VDSKIVKNINLKKTKATNIVKCHKKELITLLNNNPFSIIIDESTDVGTIKTMCICVRFFNPTTKKIESMFWSLVEVFKNSESANEGATAQKLYAEVIASFKDEKINLNNDIGFASDGRMELSSLQIFGRFLWCNDPKVYLSFLSFVCQ